MEPVATFVGRLRVLLVRVGGHQRGVDVDDHLAAVALARAAGQRSPPCPHRRPRLRPGSPDSGHRGVDVSGQRGEQPRHRWVGCDRSEHRGLGAHRGQVGQAVAAESDRGRDIEQHLARVVDRPVTAPRCQRLGQRAIQTADPDRLLEQQRARGRDQRLAGRGENHIRDRVTLHLRSAFYLSFLDCRKNKNPKQDRHFRTFRASVAPSIVKPRG